MHFTCTMRPNPQTGKDAPYYRLKETYRDSAGVVRSRILLSPGFITGTVGMELRKVAECLTYLIEHRGETDLFALFTDQPAIVRTLVSTYWQMMVDKGTIDVDRKKDYRRIAQERKLLYSETLENRDAREVGGEWLCLQAIRQLGLEDFLGTQGWDETFIKKAVSHLIVRTLYHPSEFKSLRIMRENSAACELLGLSPEALSKKDVYRIAPAFHAIKEQLEQHLSDKTDHLFNLTNRIVLFDLTNTYFEGRKQGSSKAKFGRSKEKRSDCKLLVLALCINAEGFIKYSSVLEGNTADPKSLPDMIDKLMVKSPPTSGQKDKVLVVLDAGIATEENLSLIQSKGYNYLCVSRKRLTDYTVQADTSWVSVYDCREREIKLTRIEHQPDGDYFLKIESPTKAFKEASMNEQFHARFQEMLSSIQSSIQKKGGTKKYDRVCERIGRAKERYPSVAQYYDIVVEKNEKDIVLSMTCKQQPERIEQQQREQGTYFLRTNIPQLDEKTTWDYYNLIREIESTNRQLKTDLNLRPVYHRRDENSDAHISLGLLAYWVVNTIRHQLKLKGVNAYWTEIVRIMSTQKAVTTTALNKLGENVAIRTCTVPIENAKNIYDKMKYKYAPFNRMKICSTQT